MTTMSVVGECFFWYRLTRVVPDKFHRAVKWLCVCVCDREWCINSVKIVRLDLHEIQCGHHISDRTLFDHSVKFVRWRQQLKSCWALAHISRFFTMRHYANTVYAVIICLCLCVCVRHMLVLCKRRRMQTTPHNSTAVVVLMPKIMVKFIWGHPNEGRAPNAGRLG